MSDTARAAAEVRVGSGSFVYRVAENWAQLPKGWKLHSVSDVAVDKDDNVYAFNRGGDEPMMVFDREGNFLRAWGKGVFKNPHGLHAEPDDTLYCTDDGDHTVRKFTLDGKLLQTIGVPGKASAPYSGDPFNRCTHTALSPKGDVYVTDGYGNARVHKFSPSGKLLASWGHPGSDPGQFNVPHNVTCDDAGWVYVADRENHRIQVFDGDGRYECQWNNLHRPMSLSMDDGPEDLCYIGEVGPALAVNAMAPNLGPRISIVRKDGSLVARVVDKLAGGDADQLMAPHAITVDSRGDIYVADLGELFWSCSAFRTSRSRPIFRPQKTRARTG